MQIPKGWCLVPKTPTDSQLAAAQEAWLRDPQRLTSTIYRAALDARPVCEANPAESADAELDKFEKAWRCWQQKTDWVDAEFQNGKLPVDYWGKHRADIIKLEIERLRAENERLKYREKNCSSENQAMLIAAIRFMLESADIVGMSRDSSPADVLAALQRLKHERDAFYGVDD